MGSLVETIAKIGFGADPGAARDTLGRTYEYFITEFARRGPPRRRVLHAGARGAAAVEMLEPYGGRVLDPACGSCGLFVQSARFVAAHGGRPQRISIYGQERNQATWRIGRMNLAIHGLSGEIRYIEGGSMLDDAFGAVKADFVMANPPFNQSQWSTPEILDDVSVAAKVEHPNVQIRLLEKLLRGEIRSRERTSQAQAKLFTDQIEAVLRRYELRQVSSAEVVARPVQIAKDLRDARRRHEQLGLSVEEAAFYDALAGSVGDGGTDPLLAAIASELVRSIRADLSVDWADRASSEAAIRVKIKRLLREHHWRPAVAPGAGDGDGGSQDINHYTQLVLEHAKALYRYWPGSRTRSSGETSVA